MLLQKNRHLQLVGHSTRYLAPVKTQPLDFVLSTLFLTAIGLVAFFLVATATPLLNMIFGGYHFIAGAFLFLLAFGLLSAIATRLLLAILPFSPGKHDMQSSTFTWWKLFTVVYEFGRGALLPFTTVFAKPLVAKLFGAQIGKDIALGGHLVDPEFITIGDEAIIGQGSVVTAHAITSGYIILSPVTIGARSTIGVNAVVMSGVEVGEGSVVTAGAVVPPDTKIPPGELWGGVPARKIKSIE